MIAPTLEQQTAVEEIDAIVARSPFVLQENALDRSKGRDHSSLFVYAYGDAKDLDQLMLARKLTRSELDLHHAALLAEYATRDPELIAACMEESPHHRPKWREKRGARTWLAQTIARALRDAPDHTTVPITETVPAIAAEPVRARSLREIWSDPDARKAPEAVIPHLAWRGRLTVYAALDKAGKSTFVAAGVAAMTRGDNFLGDPTTRGTCLWALLEEHVNDWSVRAQRFGTDHDAVHVLEHPADPIAAVRSEVDRLRPAVLVVDVLTRYAGDHVTESGSAAQWTSIMAGLQDIARQLGTAVIVLHHARKSDGVARDSTEITARADVVLEQKTLPEDGVQRFTVRGRWTLANFAVKLVGDRYELVAGGGADGATISPQRRKVLTALKHGATFTEWRSAAGVPPSTFKEAVAWLTQHGQAEVQEDGSYAPPPF